MEGRWIRNVFRDCCSEREVPDYKQDRLLEQLDSLIEFCSATGFCMSEEGDLLSQWRAYAENGGGVSIGFDHAYLENLSEIKRDRQDQFHASLTQVEYDEGRQKARLDVRLEQILKLVDQGALNRPTLLSPDGPGDREKREHLFRELTSHFMFYLFDIFAIKNPAFREEREWRILFYLFNYADSSEVFKHISYRTRSDRIIPYVAVDLETLSTPSIVEVVIGPRNITPTPVIERMLRAQGWENVTVRRSKATYR